MAAAINEESNAKQDKGHLSVQQIRNRMAAMSNKGVKGPSSKDMDVQPPVKKDRPQELKPYYTFQPMAISNVPTTATDGLFSVKVILSEFIQYLPIYTLSNFIRSFPDYPYNELQIMKDVYEYEAALEYKFRIGHWSTTKIETIETDDMMKVIKIEEEDSAFFYGEQRIKYHQTNIYDISQLIQLYVANHSEYSSGVPVNEMIEKVG